ncbi:MAG TPA: hypothetical protein VG165_15515 [Solirubrobacteraceae bacterium]|nr:hypothetical protein [Solirubrobacteraceae bacterium]
MTDNGDVRTMHDLAAERWPDVGDRRQLLLRLATAGRDAVAPEVQRRAHGRLRELQLAALGRAAELVDVDVLLGDEAWR